MALFADHSFPKIHMMLRGSFGSELSGKWRHPEGFWFESQKSANHKTLLIAFFADHSLPKIHMLLRGSFGSEQP